MVAGKTFGYEVAATLDAGEVRACGIDARRPCQPRLRLHNPVHLAGWIIGRRSTDGDRRLQGMQRFMTERPLIDSNHQTR